MNASTRARILPDFVTAAVAGAGAVTVMLAAKVIADVPTLPELAQDKLVQKLPGPVFAYMLENLLYLGKPMFFISMLVVQAMVIAAVGIGALHLHRVLEAAAAIWLVVGLVLLPLVGRGVFNGQVDEALVNLLAVGVFAAVLLVSRPEQWPLRAKTETPETTRAVVPRRELLAGGLFVLASAVLTKIAIGDLPKRPGINPNGLPEPITPNDQFYIVSKNLFDPEVDAGAWRLRVDGMVGTPINLTMADIEAMPSQEFVRTLECISNEVGGDLISTGRFTGVRLADVLKRAGARTETSRMLHFTSVDGYTESMPMEKALDPDTFLVYKLNGQPLPQKHGFPLRVLGAGTYGMKNPKWLTRIEVNNAPTDGFWEGQGWTPDAIVQTMSRIDSPRGRFVEPGDVRIQGIAFAGDRSISQVELSRDKGQSWLKATLLPALGPLTWVFWQLDITLPAGSHYFDVRATDGKGTLQEKEQRSSYPSGATGFHNHDIQVAEPGKKVP